MSELMRGKLRADGECVGVVMAGGSGTRFWPLSRTRFPKQFLPLAGGERSLIQATIDRITPLTGTHGSLVVTAAHQAALVVEQLPQCAVLAEPMARNTAACIGLSAVMVAQELGDIPMLCLPADHVVHGQDAILEVYRQGIALAKDEDVLVTIGIRPTAPETGYGYIEVGSATQEPVQKVRSFVEKPNRETAEQYLAQGCYFWNSGMFIWRPSVILAEIAKYMPSLSKSLEKLAAEIQRGASAEEIAEIYAALESVPIDVGVMEQSDSVMMLSGDGFMWSDVGSWSSWADARKNDVRSELEVDGDGLTVECQGVTVLSKSRFVAAVGLQDVIIVDTDDALLVCGREQAQRVKEVVEFLSKNSRDELL